MPSANSPLRLEGPFIVFGGPYSNLEATHAILEAAARLNIPPDHVICTGDVVAYGADPAATVDLIRKAGIKVVMGNCEESLGSGAEDCGCGFPAGSNCERLSAAWYAHAIANLENVSRRWMAGLPQRIDLEAGGYRFAVVHGGVDSINRFIFASTAAAIKRAEIIKTGLDGVIAGHCGLPFTQNIGGLLWHNAGAIGMPANDGTPRAWYSILTAEPRGILVEHCSLEYDFKAAASKMRRVGLPESYASALESGFWPSCDVLPWKEIRERGVRLEPGRVVWRRPAQLERPHRRRPAIFDQLWPAADRDAAPKLDPRKFRNPQFTANSEPRATVTLRRLRTLWFNTGTLCNIACRNCYIESSPTNDRLVYLDRSEVAAYLDEIERDRWNTEEIGFTGGEPFMNPDFLFMLEDALARGFRVLVLTNAMRPMQRNKRRLLEVKDRLGDKLEIRVSLDHFAPERHEDERGPGTFKQTLAGLIWLARSGFNVTVAGRTMWGDDPQNARAGFERLFSGHGIPIDAHDPAALVLFPEMDARVDVPEIDASCWDVSGRSPEEVMCASSRMVVKRKGSAHPVVVACTLIPYDPCFEIGSTLNTVARVVSLNHPHCATFCVFGNASCSSASPDADSPAAYSAAVYRQPNVLAVGSAAK